MTEYTTASFIKDAMKVVEYIDDLVREDRIEDYYELCDAAVYLQVAVNRLVWRLNEMGNRREE